MMFLFIHPENQTILWNTLQSSVLWEEFTAKVQNTEAWFRNIISNVYDIHLSEFDKKLMNIEDLKRLNKEVITICVNEMNNICRPITQPPQLTQPTQPIQPPIQPQYNNNSTTQYSELANSYNVKLQKEQKMEVAKQQFDAFQKQYQTGFDRKNPPQIDFREKFDDSKILNMEELVKQHLESRKRDIPDYNPVLGESNETAATMQK